MRPGLTNSDGVDGVGVAVIVAVVVELSSVATGDHKDAAEALPACNHTVLQRRLWLKDRVEWKVCSEGKKTFFYTTLLTLPSGWGPSTVRPSSSGPQLEKTKELCFKKDKS